MVQPSDLAGLTRWFKADALGFTDGTAIDNAANAWTDSAGSGNPLGQAVSGNRPLFKTNIVGGKAAVLFASASSQYLTGTYTTATAQPFTVMIVYQTSQTTGSRFFDSTARSLIEHDLSVVKLFSGAAEVGGPATVTTWQVAICHFNGASSQIRRNGDLSLLTTPGTAGIGGTLIYAGCDPGPGFFLNGYIAEIAVWSNDLTAVNDQDMDTYVQNKYGIVVSDYLSSNRSHKSAMQKMNRGR